jgi:hypothetical protein
MSDLMKLGEYGFEYHTDYFPSCRVKAERTGILHRRSPGCLSLKEAKVQFRLWCLRRKIRKEQKEDQNEQDQKRRKRLTGVSRRARSGSFNGLEE